MGTGDILNELWFKAEKALKKPVMQTTPEEDAKAEEKYHQELADTVEALIQPGPPEPRKHSPGKCGGCGSGMIPTGCGCLNPDCANHVGKWPKPLGSK